MCTCCIKKPDNFYLHDFYNKFKTILFTRLAVQSVTLSVENQELWKCGVLNLTRR